MSEQRSFTGFNAVVDPAEQEQKAPIVTESFMVHVQSPDCSCRVVAVGDERRGAARVFSHSPCTNHWSKNPGPQHEQLMKKLEETAKRRLLLLIADVRLQREPV